VEKKKKKTTRTRSPEPCSSRFVPDPDTITADSIFDFAVNQAVQSSSPMSIGTSQG